MIRHIYRSTAALIALAPLLMIALAGPPSPAIAGEPAEQDQAPTVQLVLHPAAEPRPALKYHLVPPLVDLRPGNAAVLYGKVTAEQLAFFGDEELWDKIIECIETPVAELAAEDPGIPMRGSHFQFLDRAARCKSVDWQLPIYEEEFYTILLPELQQTRNFGRMLAAKARMHIAKGEFDEALHTLQTGYALGRHVSQGPTLINALVGIAIARLMSDQVEALVQRPGVPNLYWALTHMPDPLIDMRAGMEAEWAIIYLSYPEFRDLETKDYPPEKWRELTHELAGLIFRFGNLNPQEGFHEPLTTALAIKGYPLAKQRLCQRGHSPDEVEAMPVPKVIVLDTVQTYEELRDEMFKWFATPHWAARRGLDVAEQQLKDARNREVIPIAGLLLPALRSAHFADARSRQSVAALRVVEAIRLYGAAHDGRLPEKLSDITEVPIPQDPVMGRPFSYRKTGAAAVLEASLPPRASAKRHGLRYQITFASKGE